MSLLILIFWTRSCDCMWCQLHQQKTQESLWWFSFASAKTLNHIEVNPSKRSYCLHHAYIFPVKGALSFGGGPQGPTGILWRPYCMTQLSPTHTPTPTPTQQHTPCMCVSLRNPLESPFLQHVSYITIKSLFRLMWSCSLVHITQFCSGSVGSLQTLELIYSQSLWQKTEGFKNYRESWREIWASVSHLSSWLSALTVQKDHLNVPSCS